MMQVTSVADLAQSSRIFRPDVLNIFTDASIKRLGEHSWRGCAGAIGVYYNEDTNDYVTMTQLMLLKHCTNNIAELAGIELGVDMALDYQYGFKRINLFSDSNISVHTYREWIFAWCRNMGTYQSPERMGDLRTSSGKSVKNLTHILDTINKICDIEQCEFNIYHCRGHHMNKLDEMITSFIKENKIKISKKEAVLLAYYNDMVDQETRDIVEHYFTENAYLGMIHEYSPYAVAPMNMAKYSKIIGGREF